MALATFAAQPQVPAETLADEIAALDGILAYMENNEFIPPFWDNLRRLLFEYERIGNRIKPLGDRCWKIRKKYRSWTGYWDHSMVKCEECRGHGFSVVEIGEAGDTVKFPVVCKKCVLGFTAPKPKQVQTEKPKAMSPEEQLAFNLMMKEIREKERMKIWCCVCRRSYRWGERHNSHTNWSARWPKAAK